MQEQPKPARHTACYISAQPVQPVVVAVVIEFYRGEPNLTSRNRSQERYTELDGSGPLSVPVLKPAQTESSRMSMRAMAATVVPVAHIPNQRGLTRCT